LLPPSEEEELVLNSEIPSSHKLDRLENLSNLSKPYLQRYYEILSEAKHHFV